MLFSQYTFWLYRPWATDAIVDPAQNPFRIPALIQGAEKTIRVLWSVLPNVGFILTAALPGLSHAKGFKLWLVAVHNVAAPLSMLFCVLMETIQLEYGEHAISYFSSMENASPYGPLTHMQRLRVCIVIMAWTSGIVFISVQAYLAFFENTVYSVALASYFGEVIGLTLAF